MCEISAEHAAEHVERVIVRVKRQDKGLRRDDAALKRLIDKKPSKKDVENVSARAKKANEANEELRKKLDDARSVGMRWARPATRSTSCSSCWILAS
jgi:hypothetical protein